MLNKGLFALASLGASAFIGFSAVALQGAKHPGWLWSLALFGLVVCIIAGIGWLLTRDDSSSTGRARADHGGAANTGTIRSERQSGGQTAGVIVNYGSEAPKQKTPSVLRLSYRLSPEQFVHVVVSLTGSAEKCRGTVIGADPPETVPYNVKWRGTDEQDPLVVGDQLIDLAEICSPQDRDDGTFLIINPYDDHRDQRFTTGYFRLFSHSVEAGWAVTGRKSPAANIFDDEKELTVKVVGLTSGAEGVETFVLGFTSTGQPRVSRLED